MKEQLPDNQTLSPWWRRSVALVFSVAWRS